MRGFSSYTEKLKMFKYVYHVLFTKYIDKIAPLCYYMISNDQAR